jgi:hypothetical protein
MRAKLIMLMALFSTVAIADEALPINPNITQENISETICQYGYTKTVRPPYAVTNRIKIAMLRARGLTEGDKSRFALDHIIALELGGSPDSLRNLQLQGWQDSNAKDEVENCLHAMVCAGEMSLEQAQQLIWYDWKSAATACR